MEISDSERNEMSEEEMCLALKGEESMEGRDVPSLRLMRDAYR